MSLPLTGRLPPEGALSRARKDPSLTPPHSALVAGFRGGVSGSEGCRENLDTCASGHLLSWGRACSKGRVPEGPGPLEA